jgi:hypothetical protein
LQKVMADGMTLGESINEAEYEYAWNGITSHADR